MDAHLAQLSLSVHQECAQGPSAQLIASNCVLTEQDYHPAAQHCTRVSMLTWATCVWNGTISAQAVPCFLFYHYSSLTSHPSALEKELQLRWQVAHSICSCSHPSQHQHRIPQREWDSYQTDAIKPNNPQLCGCTNLTVMLTTYLQDFTKPQINKLKPIDWTTL